MYGMGEELPLPQLHPAKLIGNLGAVLLVVGGAILLRNRLEDAKNTGSTNAFDAFFLTLVLLVVVTGVLSELGRLFLEPALACYIYVVHLGAVLCLFLSAPYSSVPDSGHGARTHDRAGGVFRLVARGRGLRTG